jgi:hypothetical protein
MRARHITSTNSRLILIQRPLIGMLRIVSIDRRLRSRRANTLQALSRILPSWLSIVVQFLARLAGAWVSETGVHVGGRGTPDGGGCGHSACSGWDFVDGVGLECVCCWCRARWENLGVEFGSGVVADQLAWLVLREMLEPSA